MNSIPQNQQTYESHVYVMVLSKSVTSPLISDIEFRRIPSTANGPNRYNKKVSKRKSNNDKSLKQ